MKTSRKPVILTRALEDAKIRVDVRNGLGVPNELADLQNYELVIFSNVPANRLTQNQMELIRTYVQDLGGGFMMLGSENSFGLGGYYKTPIETILPVHTDTEKKKETPLWQWSWLLTNLGVWAVSRLS